MNQVVRVTVFSSSMSLSIGELAVTLHPREFMRRVQLCLPRGGDSGVRNALCGEGSC